MPELPILSQDGKLLETAPLIIQAFEMHPDDERARSEYLANLYVRSGVKPPRNPAAVISLLHRAPSAEEIERRAQRATDNAWVASAALVMLLSITEHRPDLEIDVSRALWVVSKISSKSMSERSRWRLWQRFRSVAHLHLAGEILRRTFEELFQTIPADLRREFSDFRRRDFHEYLGIAETLRKMGVERRILAYDVAWRAPDSLALPQRTLEIPSPSEQILQALASYVPPHGRDRIEE